MSVRAADPEPSATAASPSGPGAGSATGTIDCVVPTHGRPRFLRECLESIAAQTLRPRRVTVVSDDDDASGRVVEEFRAAHEGFEVRYLARRGSAPGASASRNAGAETGDAPLLAFLDDDDLWEPRYLEAASARLTDGVDAVVTGIRRFPAPEADALRVPAVGLCPRDAFRSAPHVTGSSIVVRREVFDALHGFDSALPVQNDRDFFLRLLLSGHRYDVVAEPLVRMRLHPGARLTDPSTRRADGILLFLAKHGGQFRRRDRRVLRYISHRTRLSAPTSGPVRFRSALLTAATWSPAGSRQLPFGLARMAGTRVRRLLAAATGGRDDQQ